MSRSSFAERRLPLLALAVLVAVAAFLGWRLFYFLTDDAFIAFRYASNSLLGRGLVWNPAPFRPVEGYTSWLWVVLLRETWSITGIEPPVASNALSLLFGYATLYLGYRFFARMELPEPLARRRFALMALALAGVVSNRTFLAWLSSGLETSLFNFTFTLWIYFALAAPARRGRAWVFGLSLAATLAALTRPDGLLTVAATPVLLAIDRAERRGAPARRWLQAWPLLGTPLHVLWRRATYGEWLPNTYYAKQVAPWPESGLRYAASFALEYALWIWLALLLAWLVRERRMSRAALVTAAVLAVHFGYYTFMVGGDHFEYRVYSHGVLLVFVSFPWLAGRLGLSARATLSLLALFVVCSWPLPWLNYLDLRDVRDRERAFQLFRPTAPHFPPGLRAYAGAFDDLQRWLIEHYVGLRQQEHKVFAEFQRERLPSRAQGSKISWDDRPVADLYSVGVPGWVMPNVAIIDNLGLNDYVVARNRDVDLGRRTMAHDRRAPPGYAKCFRPNIYFEGLDLRITTRERPLTDDEITACERRFIEQLRAGG